MNSLVLLVKELIENEENMFFPTAIESGSPRSTNFEKWCEEAREAIKKIDVSIDNDLLIIIAQEINGGCLYGYEDPIPYDRFIPLARRIQQYAESYHAAQCAKCSDFCARAREICEDREHSHA